MNWNTESKNLTDNQVSLSAKRELPAWALSFLLHGLIVAALIFMLSKFRNGASEVENRSGGIVLVDIKSDTTEYLSDGDVVESSPQETQQPPPRPAAEELPPSLPGMAINDSELTGVGEELVDSLTGADSLLQGATSNRPFGGQVTTEVFGIKGTGSTFVYVF